MKFFKKFLYVMGAAVIILILSNIIYCNRALEITNYKLSSDKLKTNFRIALISDQHNKQFGKNDRKLVQKISEQKPDIIAVVGDIVTDNFANDEVMKNLLVQLAQIAPTYYCLGNHERNLASQIDFKTDIENCGAVLLDNESIEIKKSGESVLLGGLSDYPFYDFNEGNDDVPEKIVLVGVTGLPAIGVHFHCLYYPSVLVIIVFLPTSKPVMVGLVHLKNRPENLMLQEPLDICRLPVGKGGRLIRNKRIT